MDKHPKDPIEAQREALEHLERAPNHQTTEHEKGPRADGPQTTETAAERHRGGPLPDAKR